MDSSPVISRRKALFLGAGAIGALALAPSLLSPSYAGASDPAPQTNLILNASFEADAAGATASNWTFGSSPA